MKKHLVYNRPLDKSNYIEELGDLLWFVAFACEVAGITMQDVAEQNVFKLSLRYPNKYNDLLAKHRLDKTEAR